MSGRVAILQSNYLPWKGYFDLIHDVDRLVFLDDVQYTRQDWRNRNRIKTARGCEWLSIPVGTDLERRICDVELPRGAWSATHWRRLQDAYAGAPHFERYRRWLEEVYLHRQWATLSQLNQQLIRDVASELGIAVIWDDSRRLAVAGRGQERVLALLQAVRADVYVSGAAARAYLDPERFAALGIELRWKDYGDYPEYPQAHPPFEHRVTVLDLLFHTGDAAARYIWGER